MDIAALFFTLAILVLVIFFLSGPLVQRRTRSLSTHDHELSGLLAERDQILDTLQELEFDAKLGKIPKDVYPMQRAQLVQHGADVLRQIDELTPTSTEADPTAPSDEQPVNLEDDPIEQALAQRRAARVGAYSIDDRYEVLIAERRRNHTDKATGFCPKCGKPILQSDRFCAACGKAL